MSEHYDDENCPHKGCLCRNCVIVRRMLEAEAMQDAANRDADELRFGYGRPRQDRDYETEF